MDGDTTQNLEAFEKIIRFMAENNIGYGAINHPIDRDPVCGYNGIIGDSCPACGRNTKQTAFPSTDPPDNRLSGRNARPFQQCETGPKSMTVKSMGCANSRPMEIRLFGIAKESITDGPGIRFAIFTQGCPHQCHGCHNPESHAFTDGYFRDTADLIQEIIANPLLDGINLKWRRAFHASAGMCLAG